MYSFTNIPFLSALQFELSFDCAARYSLNRSDFLGGPLAAFAFAPLDVTPTPSAGFPIIPEKEEKKGIDVLVKCVDICSIVAHARI